MSPRLKLALATILAPFAVASCERPSAPTALTRSDQAPLAPASSSATMPVPEPDSDEGMWLLNDFPAARVQKRHGFSPDKAFLDHARLSSVRLAGGCSGSIVSKSGLVMTNHHCAEECIQQLSTAKRDYIAAGFSAKTEADEVKCPDIEINQLVEIVDVTARVREGTKGLEGNPYTEARKVALSKIEKECATSDKVRCDVVDLYHGGLFHLYKYERFQDVRLVFAPEFAVAFFGGDPDNFMFPRYDLDVSFLRIWDNGKPAATPHHFGWSKAGAKEGELTFVAGHPGHTDRQRTVAQLEHQRDYALPRALMRLSEMRGMLTEWSARSKEHRRIASSRLFGVENSLKARKGSLSALQDPHLFGGKVQEEKELRARVTATVELKAGAAAWDAIAAVQRQKRLLNPLVSVLELGTGFDAELFHIARHLVRHADEKGKPNEKRLREYSDARLPGLKQGLFSTAPIYDDFEVLTLGAGLVRLREELSPDHPVVKKILGRDEPRELAARLVKGSKLRDIKVRTALFEGGKAAIDASTDAMIVFARLVDDDARAARAAWEDKIDSAEESHGEIIAKARFAAYGTSVYPDATFTLRLSYGKVAGWEELGKVVPPFTTLGGAFDRHTGKDPFALPKSWLDAKDRLDLTAPFDFATTNDIIGGNSGSPIFDKSGDIVGLIFDGNIHSLGGDYGFDPKLNRAVGVHSAALLTALDKVYGQTRLVGELRK